jgi:hypothetical protein
LFSKSGFWFDSILCSVWQDANPLIKRNRVTRWVSWKTRPKCSPSHFLSKLIHNFFGGIK